MPRIFEKGRTRGFEHVDCWSILAQMPGKKPEQYDISTSEGRVRRAAWWLGVPITIRWRNVLEVGAHCESGSELTYMMSLIGYAAPGVEKIEERALRRGRSILRSQQQVGRYRVDFTLQIPGCDKVLIIEVDGESHYTNEACVRDAKRDDYLRSMGYHLVRERAAGRASRVSRELSIALLKSGWWEC